MKGSARPWELQTWTSERACPMCAIPLFAAEKDGYRIDACGSCGGSWLGHKDARRMIDTANKTPIDLARMGDAAAVAVREKKAPDAVEPVCPDCKAKLVRETMDNIEIDVCDAHGTWFDRQELEHVAKLLIREYGPAARIAEADAVAAANHKEPIVDVRNVAVGVAALTLGLLGAAIGRATFGTDAFGRRVEIDSFGRNIDPITRLPIDKD